MKGFVTVALREAAEKRMVFAAALLLGLLPLVTPLLPGAGGSRDLRQLTMLILLCAFAWGAAVALGASVYAGDLAERRLGFYLSRPISPAALFGGKLAGALLLVLGGSALVLLPGFLFGGLDGRWLAQGGNEAVAAIVIAGSVLLLPLANAAGTAIRSRSAWIAADAGALALFLAVLAFASHETARGGLSGLALVVPSLVLLLVPVACLAGGFVAAAKGRADGARTHRALSATVWSLSLAFAAVAAGLGFAASHPTPSSFRKVFGAEAAPRGGWAFVDGPTRFGNNALLLDTARADRFVRIGAMTYYSYTGFSEDGSRAVWVEPTEPRTPWGREPDHAVMSARLGDAAPRPHDTGLRMRERWSAGFLISPHGTRLLTSEGAQVSVLDLDSDRTLLAAKLDAGAEPRFSARFLSEDRLLVAEAWGTATKEPVRRTFGVWEIDLASKSVRRAGSIETGPTRWASVRIDPAGRTFLVYQEGSGLSLHEAPSGRLAAAVDASGVLPWSTRYLADGRILFATRGADRVATVHVLDAGGRQTSAFPVGASSQVFFPAQPDAGSVVVSRQTTSEDRESAPRWGVGVFDLATGRKLRELPGFLPSLPTFGAQAPPPVGPEILGSEKQRLVRLDTRTGKATVLLPK